MELIDLITNNCQLMPVKSLDACQNIPGHISRGFERLKVFARSYALKN